MPFVKANDINIYYETHGKGEPLVLVCGFAQNHLCWREFIAPLSEHFQVITFDNRGSGQTDTTAEGYNTKMLAEDIVGLLNALKIDNAHFMGESLGTLIIQRLCLSHPDRVKKAVLCAPFSCCPPIALYNVRTQLQLLRHGIDKEALMELNAAWLLSNPFIQSPEKVKKYLQDIQNNPFPQTFEGLQNQAFALEDDLRHEIENIPHHLLLLVGELDIDTPPYCAEYMAKEIGNCEIHIFKEMGHLFNYEIPEKSARHALHFLLQK